ncbi:MATE family efflux transporter, partial [Streptococcus suis]
AMALFAVVGWPLALRLANGSAEPARMGHDFLSITVYASPLLFLLSIHSDALRVEGRVTAMAIAGVLVTLANIAFNYVLIVDFRLGVGGSAWGTVLAQTL